MIIEITGGAAAKQVQIVTTNEARAFGKNELNIQRTGDFLSIQENSKPHAILYISKYDEVTVTGQPIFASAALLYAYLITNEYFFNTATGGGGVAVAMDYLTPLANYHELSWTNTDATVGTIPLYTLPIGINLNSTARWNGTDWVENTRLYSTTANVEVGTGGALTGGLATSTNNLVVNGGTNTFGAITGNTNIMGLTGCTIGVGIKTGNFFNCTNTPLMNNITTSLISSRESYFEGGNVDLIAQGRYNYSYNTISCGMFGYLHDVENSIDCFAFGTAAFFDNSTNCFAAAANYPRIENRLRTACISTPNYFEPDQDSCLHVGSLNILEGTRISSVINVSAGGICNITATQTIVIVQNNTNAANVTVNLPNATAKYGQILYIKHTAGVGNTLTLTPGAGRTIDGAGTYVNSVVNSCTQLVYHAGGAWFII